MALSDLWKGLRTVAGNAVDATGTALRAPDLGISERLAGGNTVNSGGAIPTAQRAATEQGINNAKSLYNMIAPGGQSGSVAGVSTEVSNMGPGYDPNGGSGVTNTNNSIARPTAPSGGAQTPAKVLPDRSNSINAQNAAINALASMRESGLGSIRSSLANILGGYDSDLTRAEGNFNEQSGTNKSNLQKNMQAALSNAAQGRMGLFGTLSRLGALSGSGIELANRAVQKGANQDIAGANDAFEETRTNLTQNIESFRNEDKKRREQTEASAADAERAVENQILSKRQGYYSNLADDYAQMENAAQSKRYADMAAALFPDLATTGTPAPLTAISANFNPTTLSRYVAGGGNAVSTVPSNTGSLPGLIANIPGIERRREER